MGTDDDGAQKHIQVAGLANRADKSGVKLADSKSGHVERAVNEVSWWHHILQIPSDPQGLAARFVLPSDPVINTWPRGIHEMVGARR